MKETTLNETERVRRIQDKEAPRYDRQMGIFDRILFAGGRAWACAQVNGTVLELAFGTGRNLPYYPADVRLTGIELSPQMLEIGRKRAEELKRDIDLRTGDAQALEFEDQSFDTVIITFGLCTIPDDRGAATEAHRVLRPGGRLVLLEHVRSPSLAVRAVQRMLDPLSVRFAADHLVRDPLDYLGNVGFEIDSVQRLKWGIVERVVARKPGGEAGMTAAAISDRQRFRDRSGFELPPRCRWRTRASGWALPPLALLWGRRAGLLRTHPDAPASGAKATSTRSSRRQPSRHW
jgi:ubiquinone/menaquinone biosynthesis C-methylase UbiE